MKGRNIALYDDKKKVTYELVRGGVSILVCVCLEICV